MFTFKRFMLVFICMVAFCGFGRFRRRFGRGEELPGTGLKEVEEHLKKTLPFAASPYAAMIALDLSAKNETNSEIQKTLSDLSSLPKLATRCDRESLNRSLRLLTQASQASAAKESINELDHLTSTVRFFVVKQAEFCLERLPRIFRERYLQLDEFKRKSVENAFDKYLATFGFRSSPSSRIGAAALCQMFITNPALNLERYSDSELINYGMMSGAKNDEATGLDKLVLQSADSGPEFNVKLYKTLMQKYVVEPCEYYMEELYPDIFSVAKLAIDQVHGWSNRIKETDKEFYLAWTRINLCKILLNDAEVTGRMVIAEQKNAIDYWYKTKQF